MSFRLVNYCIERRKQHGSNLFVVSTAMAAWSDITLSSRLGGGFHVDLLEHTWWHGLFWYWVLETLASNIAMYFKLFQSLGWLDHRVTFSRQEWFLEDEGGNVFHTMFAVLYFLGFLHGHGPFSELVIVMFSVSWPTSSPKFWHHGGLFATNLFRYMQWELRNSFE